jgi:hypothetical protein
MDAKAALTRTVISRKERKERRDEEPRRDTEPKQPRMNANGRE